MSSRRPSQRSNHRTTRTSRNHRARRSMQLESLETRRLMATIVVTSSNDSSPSVPGELRHAAETAEHGDTVVFDLPGEARIFLDTEEPLVIDKSITIDGDNSLGSGANVKIHGLQSTRVFDVTDGNLLSKQDVVIKNLEILDGRAPVGSGVRNEEDLSLENVVVKDNVATNGDGGGVFSAEGTRLSVNDSRFEDNTAAESGGAVFADRDAAVDIRDSQVSNNSAGTEGGGVATTGDNLDVNVENTQFTGNSAGTEGGGISAAGEDSVVRVKNVSLVGNSGRTGGGGASFALIHAVTLEDVLAEFNSVSGAVVGAGGGISFASTHSAFPGAKQDMDVTIQSSTISGNTVAGDNSKGGGIVAFGEGVIRLVESIVRENFSSAAPGGESIGGGAAFVGDYSSSDNMEVVIEDSEFRSNEGDKGGGVAAIVNRYTGAAVALSVSDSIIADNVSAEEGGGMWLDCGDAFDLTGHVTGTVITGNVAGVGGGIFNGSCALNLDKVTVSHNAATTADGGGIANVGPFAPAIGLSPPEMQISGSSIYENTTIAHGGGIWNFNGNLDMQQTTVSGNSADGNGGGLSSNTTGGFAYGLNEPETKLESVTITLNESGGAGGGIYGGVFKQEIESNNVIIAGNTANTGPDLFDASFLSAFNVIFNSLVGDASGTQLTESNPTPSGDGNIVGGPNLGIADPQLGPLANNGGPTLSHLPAPTSPVIDKGDATVLPGTATDQRGFERVVEGSPNEVLRMDMGAIEFDGSTPIVDGDFNDDGIYDTLDIDALVEEIASGENDPAFDLTGDGNVDLDDRDAWLAEAGGVNLGPGRSYLLGDANLDGVVDGPDFVAWNNHKFTATPAWSAGDFTADGIVDGLDFVAWNDNKFTSADLFNRTHDEDDDQSAQSDEPTTNPLEAMRDVG